MEKTNFFKKANQSIHEKKEEKFSTVFVEI